MTWRHQAPEATEQLLHRIQFGTKGDGVKSYLLCEKSHTKLQWAFKTTNRYNSIWPERWGENKFPKFSSTAKKLYP